MTAGIDSVVTTETGTFSLHVPTLSGTVYLAAKPQDDFGPTHPNHAALRNALRYGWFDPPATRPGGAIAVIPGQTLQFGTFKGYSVQPRVTSVRRMTVALDTLSVGPNGVDPTRLVKGEPMDTIVVTWEYDTRNLSTDATNASYSAADAATFTLNGVAAGPLGGIRHEWGPPPVNTTQGADTERGNAAAGTSMTHRRTTWGGIAAAQIANYGKRNIGVSLVVNDTTTATGTTVTAESATKELAAVAHGATGVEAKRPVTGAAGTRPVHNLTATWSGKGSPGLEHRIALRVLVEASGPTGSKWEWVVFGTDPAQPAISRATRIPQDAGRGHGKWSMAAFDLNLEDNANGSAGTNTGDNNNWVDDDDAALQYTVRIANLVKASHIRVDTRVTGTGSYEKGTPVEIPPGS